MSKAKFFLGLVIFILIVSFVFLYMGKIQRKTDVYNYLPQLREYNLYDVKFKKIYADPSYIMPYNILISFKTDTQNIIESLGLKNVQTVDTVGLKNETWIEVYRLYFTMRSVNAVRSKSVEDEEKEVTWWKVADDNKNYAAPYFDRDNQRHIVHFGEKNNGRIVCFKTGNTYYILIECWG